MESRPDDAAESLSPNDRFGSKAVMRRPVHTPKTGALPLAGFRGSEALKEIRRVLKPSGGLALN